MFGVQKITENGKVLVGDPPVARFLFQSTAASWLWLVLRVWVGYQFFTSGWGKLTGGKWLDGTGNSILPFWQNAAKVPEPPARAAVTYDWYRDFLQYLIDSNSAPWFSYVIVFGEIFIGLGLILGAFVGLAAAAGLIMNMSFLLAGTTSTNPVLALLGILLILAWKNAGYIGADRFLLPLLGTPWSKRGEQPPPAVLIPQPAPAA